MPDPNVRSLHHYLVDDHACLGSSDPFDPHHPLCFVDFLQDGERSVLRETGGEPLRPGVIVHRHIQGNLYVVIRLRLIGFNCISLVLDFLDACSSQAEDVCLKHSK